MLVLVDTSVWIDFFKDKPFNHVKLLEKCIHNNYDVCICGVILTEILQGITVNKEYKEVKENIGSLVFLPMNRSTYIKAADIYRSLRKQGITIRKPIDCMIAAVCIENDIFLLHNDKDFMPIENYCDLKILKT